MPPAQATAEAARLQALQSYAILDTPAEDSFDQLATLAARVCQCPMAVVNFVDSDRQWFKAAVGVPFKETERAIAFCAHALSGSREPMVVNDTHKHPVFAHNPLVTQDPHVRFYACVPLVTPEGQALGTLAVLDSIPRHIEAEQLEGLRILAEQAMVQLELRRQKQVLADLVQQRDKMHAELLAQSETLRVAGQMARIGGWIVELPSLQLNWSQEIAAAFGIAGRMGSVEQIMELYLPPHRQAMLAAFESCIRHGTPFDLEAELVTLAGRHFWVRTTGQAVRDAEGRIVRIQGAFQDISAQHQARQARRESEERFHLVSRATADAVWDWNLHTDAMWWNEGMQTLFGVPLDQLPPDSTSWTLRLHPDDSEEVLEGIHAAIDGTANHWSDEYRFRRQDGSYAWVLDRGFLIRDLQGKAVRMVGGMTDISAQKLADLDAQRDAQNHAELLQVQQRISSLDMPLPEVLQLVASTVLRQTEARGAMVELLQGRQLVAQAAAGDHVRPVGNLLPVDQSLLWPALSKGQTVVCNDTEAEGWDMASMPHRHGVRSVMAVPLRSGDAIVGSLKVTSDKVNAFSRRDVAHLEILTESLGAMVQLRHVAGQLHASEQQYRMLFDEHPHPMWVYDRETLQLQAVNRSMERHYGYTEAELLNMSMLDLWPAERRPNVEANIRAVPMEQRNTPVISRHIKKDGSFMDVEITAGSISFNGRPARQVLATDVTERLRTERELARMGRAQRLLSACNETLVRATSEAALLQAICQIAVDIGGYRMGWVGFALDDERKSIRPVAHAGYNQNYLENLQLSWSADDPYGRGPAGIAVRTGQPVIVQDIRTEGDFADWTERMLEHGFHGVICLPLREHARDHAQDRSFGLLYLYAPDVLQISPEEAALLQELSNDLAIGITSLRAHKAQQRLQASVLKVAAAVSASTGTEFFVQLVRNMADALDAQGGCVVRLLPHSQDQAPRVVTLAAVLDGQMLPNDEYSLTGTPSLLLMSQRTHVVTDKVQQLYPEAPVLRAVGAQAYVGQQLCNADGEVVGIVFVLFRHAIADTDFITSTLQIFASRASAEIERQLADIRIRHQASLLDKAQDAILVRDLDHRIIFWNKSAERLYGWSQLQALGQSIETLLYEDPTHFRHATQTVLEQGEWTGEIVQRHRDGSTIEVEGRWTLVRGDDGQPQSILAINTDIRQRKASEREIQRLAFYDALTGLPNRMLLMDRMHQALATAQRRQQGGALLFIDLDNFKTLNDTLGHDQGDLLLQQVAQRLNTCVRSVDTVARLGGDEFVVMLEELSPKPHELALHARGVGEKILAMLAVPYALQGYQYRSTPSIGIAPFTGEHTTVGELLKQADLAMYQAKTAGRNTLRFFDPDMQAVVTARAGLETDLRSALMQEEFLLHFQPQIHQSGRCVGVEALVRWAHPQRGMVSPAQFIPLAEETGLILPLGRWVLHTACKLLASWQSDPALSHLTMAVNVSSRQFRHASFVDDVARVLAITGAPSAQLKLELTESLLVEDMETTIATMTALRSYGVGFSLDDFGTGYSSLSYLKRMPLDQLKIDQSFVRDLLTDPNDAAIVDTIIGLSRSLGLEVIAEGVETPEQCALLARAGCQLYQGYLFSKALSVDVLDSFLRTSQA
ncbi:diguanylate cyclase/phosphodiesterase with PAS/PAC sensor(s) [Acidovorax delafieldii]|uniref:Diguanylate cyclase/phosphodiesterase with PAS/PAC sensor(S) n=1 Tax=Acidovorax delafieldii TaxID=47920 RepID=A0A561XU46_ACIDE|nr:EAL domain-containing protein [Acidovorax delafieldii]TWG39636.1 diguanylate cyclase/phosphodiesterase with PAS/PAC sensor(s) [Acidovorax delafieldii]